MYPNQQVRMTKTLMQLCEIRTYDVRKFQIMSSSWLQLLPGIQTTDHMLRQSSSKYTVHVKGSRSDFEIRRAYIPE
jgi:hypothetical protein